MPDDHRGYPNRGSDDSQRPPRRRPAPQQYPQPGRTAPVPPEQQAWSAVPPRGQAGPWQAPQNSPGSHTRPYPAQPGRVQQPPPPPNKPPRTRQHAGQWAAVPPQRRMAPPPPPQRRKWSRRRRPFRTVLIVLLLLVFVAGLGGVLLDRSLPRIDALSDYEGRIGDTPGTNFLIVGSDSRLGLTPEQEAELATGGDTGPDRTDTILLVHKPRGGDAVLVSVPRDSYVPIPGYGYEKINAAYAFGGAPLLVRTLEESTGVHIDHYVEIGFAGFAGITDAVGGVDMCLENPMSDPLAGIDLPAGCQKLSGREALGFVRSRATPLADLDRMNNQRQFMSALSEKMASPATLLNPFRSIPLARAMAGAVVIDERDTLIDAIRLGLALRGETVTTTVPVGGFGDIAGIGNVLYWDATDAPRFWSAISRGEPLPPELITTG